MWAKATIGVIFLWMNYVSENKHQAGSFGQKLARLSAHSSHHLLGVHYLRGQILQGLGLLLKNWKGPSLAVGSIFCPSVIQLTFVRSMDQKWPSFQVIAWLQSTFLRTFKKWWRGRWSRDNKGAKEEGGQPYDYKKLVGFIYTFWLSPVKMQIL